MRYVIGADLAGPEGYDAYVAMTRDGVVVWSDRFRSGSREPRFPLWLRFQIWLGRVTIVKERP